MIRSVASKVTWVGRATVFLVGLAVILALMFGSASMAFAKDGDPWLLGRSNVATAITSLAGQLGVNGPMVRITNNNDGTNDTALALNVQEGEAPMRVNSDTVVTSLNADKVDGKDSTEIGVNGWQTVVSNSALNSDSPKQATASCPSGKIVVGIGYDIAGGTSGSAPNELTDVVVVKAGLLAINSAFATALEEEPTSDNWLVRSRAICATAP